MVREQREELYSRLQTAFDILGRRLDDFFRHKKKNWEVKMQFTLSRFSADIYELQASLDKDQAYLAELENQLDIILSAGKEKTALAGVQARISSTKRSIENKSQQIALLENDKIELQNRLNEPEN
jgi:chromosome segregation ATPase